MNPLLKVLLNRCPRCTTGSVFGGWIRMNARCANCGLSFARENGYYLGAMVVSYFAGAFALVPTVLVLKFVLDAEGWLLIAVPVGQILLLGPWMFRYSRLLWLHGEWLWNPEETDAENPGSPP